MRISDSTNIYTAGKDKYLINFATASIDKIGPGLAETFERFGQEGSFNEHTAPFERDTLQYLKKRNYITVLSHWEEKKRNKREIEKRRVRGKVAPKRPALLLDEEIGSYWCSSSKEGIIFSNNDSRERDTRGIKSETLKKMMSQLGGEKGSQMDIWFKLKRRKDSWKEIHSTVRSRGFSIRKVWTVIDQGEKEEAQIWAQNNLLPQNIKLALKPTNSTPGDYYLISSSEGVSRENLFSRRLRSLFEEGSGYFVCPFIYNTVFVTGAKKDYCPVKVGEGRADSFSSDSDARGEIFTEGLLSKGCEELPKNCIFRTICDSTCWRFGEKIKGDENGAQAWFEKILGKAISGLSLPLLKEQID